MGFVVYILSDTLKKYSIYYDTTQQSRNRYELEGTWFPTMEWYDSVHTLFREYNFLDFPLNIIDTLCYLPGSSVMIQFRDSTMMEKKTVYAQLSCQDLEYPPGFLEFLNRLKYFISKITQS